MAIALTPFAGFCGFRPPSEIASFVGKVPEFATLLGDDLAASFRAKFGADREPTDEDKKAGLKQLFSALMRADDSLVQTQVGRLVKRLGQAADGIQDDEVELIQTLNRDFPGDVGIFCTFVLNIVQLKPGEAVFLKADEPHAYLSGGQ